jgi:hypothetical protein
MMEVDVAALSRDIAALSAKMRQRFMEPSRVTAERLEREMKARLQRQLSAAATGQSVDSISHQVAYDGNGYVVFTDRDPYPNLPLWLEKGTKPGKRKNFASTKARPFFYASIALEAPGHERRIRDTWNALALELNR